MPEQGDFVRVMSLHKSKGLTSRGVIVPGCIQGMIPFQDRDETPDEQSANLQEQRRLFYVVITRCTELLVLSSAVRIERKLAWKLRVELARGRSAFGNTIASQFTDELGPSAPAPISGNQWQANNYGQ